MSVLNDFVDKDIQSQILLLHDSVALSCNNGLSADLAEIRRGLEYDDTIRRVIEKYRIKIRKQSMITEAPEAEEVPSQTCSSPVASTADDFIIERCFGDQDSCVEISDSEGENDEVVIV